MYEILKKNKVGVFILVVVITKFQVLKKFGGLSVISAHWYCGFS